MSGSSRESSQSTTSGKGTQTLAASNAALTEPNKIADTFNEYGTPVTMFRCCGCGSTFTVCPAVKDDALNQWAACLGEGCSTYDPARDADKLFDESKVRRRGERLLTVIEGGEK